MKQLLCVILSLALAVSLAGCGGNNGGSGVNEVGDISGKWLCQLGDVTDIYEFTGDSWSRTSLGLASAGTYKINDRKLELYNDKGSFLMSHPLSMKGDVIIINKLEYIKQ